MLKGRQSKGISIRMASILWLVVAVFAGANPMPAQTTVEARLAALEARIRQLEGELATTRRGTGMGVAATDAALMGAMIRPAVLTSSETLEVMEASAAAVAAPAAASPPQQGAFTDDV